MSHLEDHCDEPTQWLKAHSPHHLDLWLQQGVSFNRALSAAVADLGIPRDQVPPRVRRLLPPQRASAPKAERPRPDLIPGAALLAVGEGLAFGVTEHAERSEEPTAEMRIASAMRHLCACLQDRDAKDDQSGLPHLHSAAAQLLFAIDKHQREKTQ